MILITPHLAGLAPDIRMLKRPRYDTLVPQFSINFAENGMKVVPQPFSFPQQSVINFPNDKRYKAGKYLNSGCFGIVNDIIPFDGEVDQHVNCLTANAPLDSRHPYALKKLIGAYKGTIPLRESITSKHPKTINGDFLHELDVFDGLNNQITSEDLLEKFEPGRNTDKQQLLESAHQEIAFIKRYYEKSGRQVMIDSIQVVTQDPVTQVTFHCFEQSMTFSANPGVSLIMPKIPGVDLWTYAYQNIGQDFSFDKLLTLFAAVTHEFLILNKAGILHLDASPANIMVNEVGENFYFTFIDFGFSKILGEHNVAQTLPGDLTPYHRSHRHSQTQCDVKVSVHDDAFALSKTLLHLLSRFVERNPSLASKTQKTLLNWLEENLKNLTNKLDHIDSPIEQPLHLIHQTITSVRDIYASLDANEQLTQLINALSMITANIGTSGMFNNVNPSASCLLAPTA